MTTLDGLALRWKAQQEILQQMRRRRAVHHRGTETQRKTKLEEHGTGVNISLRDSGNIRGFDESLILGIGVDRCSSVAMKLIFCDPVTLVN
jgi:hypothetical protein